jgi:hypothetical protein
MPWPPGWRAPIPLVPVWNSASRPCRSQAANTGQYFGSSGANACSDGWNLTPRSPSSAMRATSSTAESLCGSTDPSPVNASGYSRQAAATVSFGTRGRPVAVSASQASRTASTSSARYLSASAASDCRSTVDRKYASAAST